VDLIEFIRVQMVKNDCTSVAALARKAGFPVPALWKKMTGEKPLSVRDMYRLGDTLGWSVEVTLVMKETGERIPFIPQNLSEK